MSQPTVAALGTGIMGSATVRNIVDAGHAVRAWNRTIPHTQPLADDGVEVALTATAAVEGVDVVIAMLFDGAAVAEVVREAASVMCPGVTWLQMTIVSSDDVVGLAAIAESARILFHDSSASGIRQLTESGTLVIMTAGPASGRELVIPVLDAVRSRTVWIGEDGAAATSARLKLVVNSWVIAVSNATGETITLARAIGVPPAQLFEMLDGGGLDLPLLRIRADLVERGALSPVNFAVDIFGKDAHLTLELIREAGLKLDGMEAFSAWLDRVAEAGHACEDMVASYLAGLLTSIEAS